jgi:molybdopterin molybdotransferase
MDGYALRSADTVTAPVRLAVLGTISAGDRPGLCVVPGGAVRIMTGAPLPVGADAVCMVERTSPAPDGQGVVIGQALLAGTNVRLPGEDIEAGTVVFDAGTPIGPAHIGALASLGVDTVRAYPQPRVGVMSTGNELAADASAPGPARFVTPTAPPSWHS